jgi:hypothetical protein
MGGHFDIIFFNCINIFAEAAAAKFFVSRSAGGSWTPNKRGGGEQQVFAGGKQKIFRVCKRTLFFLST